MYCLISLLFIWNFNDTTEVARKTHEYGSDQFYLNLQLIVQLWFNYNQKSDAMQKIKTRAIKDDG